MRAQLRLQSRDLVLQLVARGRCPGARVDARLDRPGIELGDVVGDERPAAVLRDDEALALEPLVDGADGVDVDAGHVGEAPDAGQLLALLQAAVRDQRLDLPRELGADRHIAIAIDLEAERIHARSLAHCAVVMAQ